MYNTLAWKYTSDALLQTMKMGAWGIGLWLSKWVQGLSCGVKKMLKLCWWLHNCDYTKNKLYTLKELTVWYVNYILLMLLKTIKLRKEHQTDFESGMGFRGSTWVRSNIRGRNLISLRKMLSAPWVAKISLVNGAIELARSLSLKKDNKNQGEKGALGQRPLMRHNEKQTNNYETS